MFSDMDSTDITVLLVSGGLILVIIVIIIIGVYRHTYKAAFKPKFIALSDGSLKMEFYNFGGVQTTRTKRFYEQYQVGMVVPHNGRQYRIAELKEVADLTWSGQDLKMVAYLEEV